MQPKRLLIYAGKAEPMNQERMRAARPRTHAKAKRPVSRARRHERQKASNLLILRWLFLFWPVGIIFMWASNWKKANKIAATVACVAMTAILVFGGIAIWDGAQRAEGGTHYVAVKPEIRPYGPEIPEGVSYSYKDETIYIPAVVVTPEPTPEPETAFVNDGGKNFHTEGCKYTSSKSGAYYVPNLLAKGFTPCKRCGALQLAAEYTGDQ